MLHTITYAELRDTPVRVQLASAAGRDGSKRLELHYDIGRKRLTFRVSYSGSGDGAHTFDTIEEAIEAYNEIQHTREG